MRNSKARKKKPSSRDPWAEYRPPSSQSAVYALPASLPIPAGERERLRGAAASSNQIAGWIRRRLREVPEDPRAGELSAVADRLERFQAGLALARERDFRGAASCFRSNLQDCPKDKISALNLAFAEIEDGMPAEGLERLDGLGGQFASDPRAMLMRAAAVARLGRREEAAQELWAAHRLHPGNLRITAELVKMRELVPVSFHAGEPARSQVASRKEYDRISREQARKFLEAGDRKALLRMARFQLDSGNPGIAAHAASLAMEAVPGDLEAMCMACRALAASGRLEEAEQVAGWIMEDHGAEAQGAACAAHVQRLRGNPAAVRAVLLPAVERDADSLEAFEEYLLAFDNDSERLVEARRLAALHPGSWVACKMVADLLFNAGTHGEAIELHREAFRQGDHDDALTMLLNGLAQTGRWEEAARIIEADERLDKRSATVRWNAAHVALCANRNRRAERILASLVEDPAVSAIARYEANLRLAEMRLGAARR